jgi:hypothetical protein
MIEPREKEIDGIKFTVRQLPAMKALRMLNRLTRTVGPAVASLGAGGLDMASLPEALAKLGEKLSDAELESITRELLADTTFQPVDGGPGGELMKVFDQTLAGRPETTLKLLAFALEANFANFFGDLQALAARRQGSPSAGQKPSPTSGPPGASS